jgi:hypothetical protein
LGFEVDSRNELWDCQITMNQQGMHSSRYLDSCLVAVRVNRHPPGVTTSKPRFPEGLKE